MFFPIGDEQVVGGHKPVVTWALLAFNIVAFFIQMTSGEGALVCELGSIPAEIANGEDWYTLLTSMFMHGGWMHLIGNMLFLWVFADNIEATVGSIPFLAFYLIGGLAASALHIVLSLDPAVAGCCEPCGLRACAEGMTVCAGTVPSVGASGAISAVLGAYLVMFPKSKVDLLVLVIFRTIKIPAFIFLGLWIGQQLISGFAAIGPNGTSGGVAWWAHIGGFIFGVLAGFVARMDNGKVQKAAPSRQLKKSINPGDLV